MKNPITNSYRAQNLQAAIKLIRPLGPKAVKPSERDEIVRVLEGMVQRLQVPQGKEEAA